MPKMNFNRYFYTPQKRIVNSSSPKKFFNPNDAVSKFIRIQQKNSQIVSPFKIIRHFSSTPTNAAKILPGRRRSSSTEKVLLDQKKTAMKIVSKYKVQKFKSSPAMTVHQQNAPLIRLGKYKMVKKSKLPISNHFTPTKKPFNKKTATSFYRNFNTPNSSASSHKFNKRSFVVGNKFKLNRKSKTPLQTQASKVLQRSVEILSSSKKSKLRILWRRSMKQLCPVFIRSGRCPSGERCRFVHDSEKVSVCKKFLRGICVSEKCPFSHDVSPDKMPLCRFFLKGACGRTNCPYLHVKHSLNAKICQKFRTGYCPNGAKCTNLHVERDTASDDAFRFLNGKRTKTKQKSTVLRSIKAKLPRNSSSTTTKQLNEPLPSFISLTPNVTATSCESLSAVDFSKIQIVPSFLNF